MILRFKLRFFLAATAILLASASVLWACQVPVFRYALERWESDNYSVVFTPGANGKLSATEQEAFDFLTKASASEDFPANLNVTLAEISADKPASDAATMALMYPQKVRGLEQNPIWSGAATLADAKKIVDSPVRREIVKAILSGKSAVWMVVESGDDASDNAATAVMEKVATEAADILEIPEGVIKQSDLGSDTPPTDAPIDPENILQSEVPLKIDFSVFRVSRDDPAEAIFLKMLLNLEDDLGEFSKEPMVFPVFGRGRALEPLIGCGATRNNAMDYAGYLCGACSCEVKDQNPGMDLLVTANWDLALEGSHIIIDKILPPLEGLTGLSEAAVAAAKTQVKAAEVEGEFHSASERISDTTIPAVIEEDVSAPHSAFNSWWLVIGGVILFIGITSVVILKKQS